MAQGALSDLKVVELARGVPGAYCGRMFAGLGAEVIKIEEPGAGDAARRWGPFPDEVPHPEKSGFFLYLNTSKKGVTLNLREPEGIKIFKELVKGADILVEDQAPRHLESLGLGYETLKALNPRLILTSITPFGQSGPYRDWKGSDLVCWMAGGGYYTPTMVDDPEKEPPLKLPGHNLDTLAAHNAAAATMLALFHRRSTGLGQHVDISEQETAANTHKIEVIGITYDAAKPSRLKREALLVLDTERAKDGRVWFMYTDDSHWRATQELIGNPEWAKDERFADMRGRMINMMEIRERVNEWLLQHSKVEVAQMGQEAGIPCGPVQTIAEAAEHPQWAAHGFFVDIDHPVAGRFRYPGALSQLSQTPWSFSPAPLLGEHNEELFCQRLGYSKEALVTLRATGVI